MLVAAEKAGFDFHNMLVWDKGTATPNRWYMKNCEFTGFFYKKPARAIADCGAKQLISCPQVDVTDHPTEKPVPLMRHYIEQSSARGDIVLDPFMGSGSTGVAAVQSGRRFIGIEKDERFFNMAVRRILDAVDNFQERLI
jgi:site-specific DNA-methyltransferase (adenine-specific)